MAELLPCRSCGVTPELVIRFPGSGLVLVWAEHACAMLAHATREAAIAEWNAANAEPAAGAAGAAGAADVDALLASIREAVAAMDEETFSYCSYCSDTEQHEQQERYNDRRAALDALLSGEG